MAKNKKNKNKNVLADFKGSVAERISKSLNKHGEIKGENKKETKNLKAMCNHHKLTKKQKIKAMVYNNGNGQCTCTMCGKSFPTHLYDHEELMKVVGKTQSIVSQAAFMTAAAGLGKDTEKFIAELSIYLNQFPKVYGKVKTVVEKSEKVKKKKKNKGYNNNDGSENYGGWR